MTMLVDLREKIKRLYGQYGVYVQIAAKFLLALAILLFIGCLLYTSNPPLSEMRPGDFKAVGGSDGRSDYEPSGTDEGSASGSCSAGTERAP